MKKVGLSILLIIFMVLIFANKSLAASAADFSNAKYSFEYFAAGSAFLKITGVNIASDEDITRHKIAITTENVEPTVDDDYQFINIFKADDGGYKSGSVESFLQLNYKNYYVWVYFIDYSKTGNDKYNLLNAGGTQVARIADKLYSDVFSATFLSKNQTQIVLNVPWESMTQRNMQIKVGEINDISILNKIKNSDVNGMKELLSYAKSTTNAIYNQKVKSTMFNSYSQNGYSELIDLGFDRLKDKSYYFLYVQLDDENGKYYPVEGVTLAQSSKIDLNNYWSMIFLGSDEFSWSGLATPEPTGDPTGTTDTSISTQGLPYTGKESIIALAIVSVIASCVLFVKNEDYKDVK